MWKAVTTTLNRALTSPLLWGSAAFVAFQFFLKADLPGGDFLRRYTAGHPIEYIETFLFFLALAALIHKGLTILYEWSTLDQPWLSGPLNAPADRLLGDLDALPEVLHTSPVFRQLRAGLSYLCRGGTAQELDQHLAFAAEQEADERRHHYAFVRLVIWAIPILGFLGTVVGITLSLGNLAPQQLEETLPAVMAGLMVAFDTTALALALSMILMLVQYVVERSEQRLLAAAGEKVENLLLSRFPAQSVPGRELTAVRVMLEEVLTTCRHLVETQVTLWQQSLEQAQKQWQGTWSNWQEQLGNRLATALENALQRHADRLHEAEAQLFERLQQRELEAAQDLTARWKSLLTEASRQQEEWASLQKILQGHVTAWQTLASETQHLARLEELLQQNLTAIGSAKHFEEALASLAAAANLLSAHLHRIPLEP
ncbi:MAG TPA: MotA/TolQ/ExbB proton channel family protein, partial [Thermogutta sp.]|nr:MotA/TolQ/ExbB proton channel family protein [Thermogutta sp.]